MKKARPYIIALSVVTLIVALYLLSRPTYRGFVDTTNIVTLKDIRENPERYMNQQISFEVGELRAIASGYGFDTTCRRMVIHVPGFKAVNSEHILELLEQGEIDDHYDPDLGYWRAYIDCGIPGELMGLIPDSLNYYKVFRSEDYGTKWGDPHLPLLDKKGALVSGILFKIEGRGVAKDSLALAFTEKTGRTVYSTIPWVYLTGVRVPSPLRRLFMFKN